MPQAGFRRHAKQPHVVSTTTLNARRGGAGIMATKVATASVGSAGSVKE